MPGTDKRRSHHRIPIFVLVASLVALFGVAATSNPKQEGAEKILKEGRSRNNVTEITKLKLKGATVLFAKKFPGDDDWLNGLTISVKNISPKPMVYIELELILFGEGDKEPTGKPLYIYPLTYGRYVGRDTTEPLPTSEGPQPIGPGSTIDFVLTEEVYTSLKNHLVGAGYPLKMKQAELLITDVFFADGTRWYKGMRLKRNPHNPVEWVKDAPNQVKVDRKPNPPNSLRASQAKAKFISANFYPGLMPSPGANRARPLGGAGLSAQVPCQEAKTPIDEVPCGMEVPGCIVKDDRVEGAPMEAPARLISGTKACTRPASDPGGHATKAFRSPSSNFVTRRPKQRASQQEGTGSLRGATVISAPRHALARPPRTPAAAAAARAAVPLTAGTPTPAPGIATRPRPTPLCSWT